MREKENRKKQLKNFDKIKKFLLKYNFSFLVFEKYSFEDQIKIMKNCEMLVGIHGAGFTNMLFMDKGSKVIDIIPYYYSLPRTVEFKLTCEIMSLDYHSFYTINNHDDEKEYEINENEFQDLILNNI